MKIKKLTIEQANLLDKIASRSGMDCWFTITDDLCHIKDLESNKIISLKKGIKELNEGITDLRESYYLTDEEIKLYQEIIKQYLY